MKIIPKLILFALIFNCSVNAQIKNLKGQVKSLRQNSYEVINKSGEISKGEKSHRNYYYGYDVNGNLIEEIGFNKDGIFLGKHTYKYNDEGDWIEKNLYGNNGSLSEIWIDEYDVNGYRIYQLRLLIDGRLYEKTIFENDNKGNVIESITYREDGGIERKMTYKYDERGNTIERIGTEKMDVIALKTLINTIIEEIELSLMIQHINMTIKEIELSHIGLILTRFINMSLTKKVIGFNV